MKSNHFENTTKLEIKFIHISLSVSSFNYMLP